MPYDRHKQAQKQQAADEAIAGRRSQPHDPSTERSVLAAIAADSKCRPIAFESLKSHHFYLPQHQLIFEAEGALYKDNREMDIAVIENQLRTAGTLEDAGGDAYVREVLTDTTGMHLTEYIEILLEQHTARMLHRLSFDVLADIHAGGSRPSEVLNRTASEVNAIISGGKQRKEVTVWDVFNVDVGRPVPSGQPKLDDKLGGGFYPGELIIIAARASTGKTSQMCQIQLNTARAGYRSLTASIEELEVSIWEKWLANESGEDYAKIRAKQLFSEQGEVIWDIRNQPHLKDAATKLHAMPMKLETCASLSPDVFYSKLLRQRMMGGIDIAFADYLQIFCDEQTARDSRGSRSQEIGVYSRKLKNIAIELQIPLVVLCQVNREPDKRISPEPNLSDLGESGKIEQDADVVIFLYRPTDEENPKSNLRLKIAKQRHGPVTWGQHNLLLDFDYKHQRITEWKDSTGNYKPVRADPYQ